MYLFIQRLFPHLCDVPDLVAILRGISETYDISPLLRYLLPHLVGSVIGHVKGVQFHVYIEMYFLRFESLKVGTRPC